jgi:hypothetical protein
VTTAVPKRCSSANPIDLAASVISSAKSRQLPLLDFNVSTGLCGHYFLADSTPALLGVIDSGPRPSVDLSTTTAVGSHSVAADSETNLVYVPIRGNTAVAGSGAVCSKATDVFGLAGSDALGCILSYVAPRDGDDR